MLLYKLNGLSREPCVREKQNPFWWIRLELFWFSYSLASFDVGLERLLCIQVGFISSLRTFININVDFLCLFSSLQTDRQEKAGSSDFLKIDKNILKLMNAR